MLKKHLSVFDGYILYTTSVVGLGLIVLPSIVARLAGPYSIIIWIGLSVISYSMGRVMSQLGSIYPSSGGVTHFIAAGLGKRVGFLSSILYLSAIAVGAPATALFFGEYLFTAFKITSFPLPVVAYLFLILLVVINMFRVELAMKIQKAVFFVFLILTSVGIISSLFYISPERLTDVHGYTFSSVISAPLICFFAFVGWENAAFSGEEFNDDKALKKSLFWSVLTVGFLFGSIAIATIGSLDRSIIAISNRSLSDLFLVSFGKNAEIITSFLAIVIIFVMMISWVRGASRLVYSLAKDGILPKKLSYVDVPSSSPRPALLSLLGVWTVSLLLYWVIGLEVDDYLRMASINFLTTYVLIFVAAYKLPTYGKKYILHLWISSIVVLIVFLLSYSNFWYPLVTILIFTLYIKIFNIVLD